MQSDIDCLLSELSRIKTYSKTQNKKIRTISNLMTNMNAELTEFRVRQQTGGGPAAAANSPRSPKKGGGGVSSDVLARL